MKPCPYCAEEIQDAAIRCKHCRSDLVSEAPGSLGASATLAGRRRNGRRMLAGMIALTALLVAAPVLARSVTRALRTSACEPASWGEWHDALRKQCLQPSYVCQHMTTPKLLEDPEVLGAFQRNGSRVADVVGRMRDAYGCAPERAPAFHPSVPEPGPFAPPAFPPTHDAPRAI